MRIPIQGFNGLKRHVIPQRSTRYERVCEIETLTRAWQSVRRGGGAGTDGQTVAAFEERWADNMAALAAELRAGRFQPLPLRQYLIPKADGRQRPISLLALRDRTVQRAVLDVVRADFERVASPGSFGVLPGRGVGGAIARAEAARRTGNTWVARTDIHAFFDEVERRQVIEHFRRITQDERLTALVAQWLDAGILGQAAVAPVSQSPAGRLAFATDVPEQIAGLIEISRMLQNEWRHTDLDPSVVSLLAGLAGPTAERLKTVPLRWALLAAGAAAGAALILALSAGAASPLGGGPRGTPQGSPLSPLLASSVLDPIDRLLDHPDRVLVRYVDDILLVCRDEATARRGLDELRGRLARLGLTLSDSKTFVQPYDEGFTFLGERLPQSLGATAADAEPSHSLAEAFRSTSYWRTRTVMHARQMAARSIQRGGQR